MVVGVPFVVQVDVENLSEAAGVLFEQFAGAG